MIWTTKRNKIERTLDSWLKVAQGAELSRDSCLGTFFDWARHSAEGGKGFEEVEVSGTRRVVEPPPKTTSASL